MLTEEEKQALRWTIEMLSPQDARHDNTLTAQTARTLQNLLDRSSPPELVRYDSPEQIFE